MMEQIELIIIKYLSGSATSEEQSQLLEWLEGNPDNQRNFRSLKDAYDLGQIEELLPKSNVDEQWVDLMKKIAPSRRSIKTPVLFKKFMHYAAVFILGIICYQTLVYVLEDKDEVLLTNIETGVGERAKITLPDGSRVWINSCSKLSYDSHFGEQDRPVEIQGEAYFEVHSDVERPFLVHNGLLTFRVTGTSFNVSAFREENETSIALLEGGVMIEIGKHVEKLHPGEKFTFNKKTGKYKLDKADVGRLTNWRNGEIIFKNISFEELANKLERSFNVKFIFLNDKLKTDRFSGSFHNYDPMETILEVLRTSTSRTQLECVLIKDTVYIK